MPPRHDTITDNVFEEIDYSTVGEATKEGSAGGMNTAYQTWERNTFEVAGRAQGIRGGLTGNVFRAMLMRRMGLFQDDGENIGWRYVGYRRACPPSY